MTLCRWRYQSGETGEGDLYLGYELDCSAWALEVDDTQDPHELTERFLQHYVGLKYADQLTRWPIVWSVEGDRICEQAPYQHKYEGTDLEQYNEDFLSYFTWPVDLQTGTKLNWFSLPIKPREGCDFVERATGWRPGTLQEHVNLVDIAHSIGISL